MENLEFMVVANCKGIDVDMYFSSKGEVELFSKLCLPNIYRLYHREVGSGTWLRTLHTPNAPDLVNWWSGILQETNAMRIGG